MAVADLPTYGYRRVWALLRRESERDGLPVVNAKRVYRIMRTHNLLLERKPADPCRKRAHKGRVAVAESNRRWCSDGFEFRCDNGEKLRVTFAQDCCDREIIDWAASTGGYDKETVQDVMLGAVEKRFGRQLPTVPAFARLLGLEPCTTAVRSPESNGIAESFVMTIKRDYISIMPKPDNSCCRSEDIVCRFGGEEFVVFLPNTSVVTAECVAERIRSVIESTVFPNNLRVTVSAGVATQEDPLGGIEFLLKNADDALYQAKGEGRNKVIVYSAI